MKIIVAGSRDFNNYELLKETMDKIIGEETDITIISGCARGADKLGERYAEERKYKLELYPAEWDKFGRASGYIRNRSMALNGEVCVVFWDGQSKGTQHMINLSNEYNLKTHIIKYND
jgi:hypothetical protein